MDWLETKYIGIVSHRLRNFKRKGPNLYNFSCPLCGDSEKSSSKARAYFYEKDNKSAFHCHNCGASSSVMNFVKKIDLNIFQDYQLEKLSDSKPIQQVKFDEFVDKMKKPEFLKSGPLKNLKKISQLSADHPMKQFVVKRKIPNPYHAKLFLCPNFMSFVNTVIPKKFSENALKHDETRLLIPFFDRDKNLHAFQGRALKESQAKYITIVLDETVPKVYGLDTVDQQETFYVFEGPIDSMFIKNSVAAAGGEMISAVKGLNKDKAVIVYDNEPRSKETVDKMAKAIDNGYSIVIWPSNFEHKDINDMVLAGYEPDAIRSMMEKHTFQGLAASLELKIWSKRR